MFGATTIVFPEQAPHKSLFLAVTLTLTLENSLSFSFYRCFGGRVPDSRTNRGFGQAEHGHRKSD